jgi:hypothetical protein
MENTARAGFSAVITWDLPQEAPSFCWAKETIPEKSVDFFFWPSSTGPYNAD